MKLLNSVETIKRTAIAMLEQVDALEKLVALDIPGEFVFSPPDSSRLRVTSLDDLHEARSILRKHFGWRDSLNQKFYSCGVVIATYYPSEDVKLPLPFNIWVEASPETFPKEILGDCKLVKYTHDEYSIVCPVG